MSPEYRRTGVGVMASAFTPAKISGLKLWLAADRITGLVDNDPVGTWPDASGNGNDATQVTAAKKPLYKVAIVNGKPVVRFDGVDDALNSTLAAASAQSIFVVAAKLTAAGAASKSVWARGSASAQMYTNTVDGAGWLWFQPITSVGGTPTAWTILEMIFANVTSVTAYLNGATGPTFDPADAYSTGTQMNLGSNSSGGTFGDYDIPEVLGYERALGTNERGSVRAYLGSKYGITVN